MADFTHFNDQGRARMVDVGEKDVTRREAVAAARVLVNRETFDLIRSGGVKKGDVLTVAQVAGIMGANALLGDKLTERQMLTLATAIEGHPDNVAPAMLGGFVTSVIDEGQVYSVKKDIDPELAFAAFVPDFRLLTSKARAALPAMVSHKDAVYNLSRAALATAAFCEGNYALLGVATKDVLHQKRAATTSLSWRRTWVRRPFTSRAPGRPSWPLCTRTTPSFSPAQRQRWLRTARCTILPCIVCWPTTLAQW